MIDLAAACTAGTLGGKACVDLSHLEEIANQPLLIVGAQPNIEHVVYLQSERKQGVE